MDILSKCCSSSLTNAGETVDERIIDAPDGRAVKCRKYGQSCYQMEMVY
jgi:hypothetical protein